MPLFPRSSSLPLLSLCPPCSSPKLLQLTARPHLNMTTKNIQTSSERCKGWVEGVEGPAALVGEDEDVRTAASSYAAGNRSMG